MIKVISKGFDSTLMNRPCVTVDIKGKVVNEVSEIKLTESTASKPAISFLVRGGNNHKDIHFYKEADLYSVYRKLKSELSNHGVKFTETLTD